MWPVLVVKSDCYIFIIVFIVLFPITFAEVKLKVTQGTGDIFEEFPFVVSLNSHGMLRLCTGSLLTDEWVLTAAHCTKKRVTGKYHSKRIRFKDFTIRNKTQSFSKILAAYTHPSFGLRPTVNDIALIKVKKVPLNHTGKLSSVHWEALTGSRIKYAGFGHVYDRDSAEAFDAFSFKPLQVGQGQVVNCDRSFKLSRDTDMCVASRCINKIELLQPADSGGPALYRGKIIGIANGFFYDELPIVRFTPISPYLSWIKKTMEMYS